MTLSTKTCRLLFISMAFTLVLGFGVRTSFAQVPDPGATGSFAVTREEYDFGDTAFTATNFPGPIELRASIHYPTNLAAGPFPVILFLHGRHATCFNGSGSQFLEWPCSSNKKGAACSSKTRRNGRPLTSRI